MEDALALIPLGNGADVSELIDGKGFSPKKDQFDSKGRKAWDKDTEARCDFEPKVRMVHRAGFYFFALWKKSILGRTLTEIKGDDSEVGHFAEELSRLISEVLGSHLQAGGWCVVTTPKRRHLVKNFATRVSEAIGERLGIPFYEDVAACKSRHRVNAEFELLVLPREANIIVVDDFVTTGSTMKAMKVVLEGQKKNVVLFAGINNKL